jgi:arabinose-5-phosphate isomerase
VDLCANANAIEAAALAAVENDAKAVSSVAGVIALGAINGTFVQVVRLLSECEGKVVLTGSGTSASMARRAAHLLSVVGTPSFFLSPGDGLHGGLGAIRGEDVVVAISKGGDSSELNEFCSRGKKLGKALVAVTSEKDSPLAQLADHALVIPLVPDADLGGVVATGSSLAAGALLDGLVEGCRVARGYEWKSFFFTHPGGAVGKNAAATLENLTSKNMNPKDINPS